MFSEAELERIKQFGELLDKNGNKLTEIQKASSHLESQLVKQNSFYKGASQTLFQGIVDLETQLQSANSQIDKINESVLKFLSFNKDLAVAAVNKKHKNQLEARQAEIDKYRTQKHNIAEELKHNLSQLSDKVSQKK